MVKLKRTSTTPRCSRPIPAEKTQGNSVPGAVFSHKMSKIDFYHFHCFTWEKTHQINISHAMVISTITSLISWVHKNY